MVDYMERNREGRRGGNGSIANANVSANRRPRTPGFRDASEDESQNSRLQLKKEGLSSRKRRNRRSSNGESQQYRQSEEREESFEDAAMAASEEDDDLPPPPVRRRSAKLKIHLKTHEDVNRIDMAVVPRKLRTAMLKRYQDSTPPHYNESRRRSSTEAALVTAAPACSSGAMKPARRMKPSNHKLRPEKLPKVSSTTISEQEAEVAETLFDLARMFSSQATNSNSETKSEPNSEMKMGANPAVSPLSSVKHCSSPVAATAASPSSNNTMSVGGGSRRKLHHVSESKDAGEDVGIANRCLSTSSLGMAAESADADPFADACPFQAEASTSPRGEPLPMLVVASAAVSPSTSTNASLPAAQILQNDNCLKIEEDIIHQLESGNHVFTQKSPSTSFAVENKASVTNFSDARSVAENDIAATERSVAKEIPIKLEVENGALQLPLPKSDHRRESEIDLMAPPKSADEINDIMDSKKLDIKEEQEISLPTVPAAENSITEMERCEQKHETMNIQTCEQDNQIIDKMEHDWCNDRESGKAIEQIKDTSNQSDSFDRVKQEVAKQPPKGSGKNVKAELRGQRGDKSASATTSATIAASSVAGTTLPVSMGIAGWAAGLPPLGYYSPAAAAAAAAVAVAWPSHLPLTGASTENIKLPPHLFLQTRNSWKRCATHVYISHFIEYQQQSRKNPLWTAAFGANTYNLSIPMAPGGVMGVSVGSVLGPEIKGSGLAAGPVYGRGCAMTGGAKDKSSNHYVDVTGRKPLLEKKTQTAQQQQHLSLFSQAGPAFVFPVTQSASASATGSDGGGNVGPSEAMLGRGSSASLSSSSIYVAPGDTGIDPSNRGIANAAAAQAQLLHSVIQHNVFPYSFPHRQYGPLFSGHPSPQQVPQFYSNPFFGPHLPQPPPPAQHSQSPSTLASEISTSQKQQYSQGCSFASSVSSQQTLHSAGASSLEQHTKKEGVVGNGVTTAEMRSAAPRIVYGQTSPSVNFPSTVLAAGMPSFPPESQDLSTTSAGRQASKMYQQAQTQFQSQHQAAIKWQQQQQDINTKHSETSSALQMNLKSADLYTSGPASPVVIGKNKGSDAPPAVLASQRHAVPQTVGDCIRGLGQYQTAPDNLFVSGHSQKFSISEGPKQQKQHHIQTERLVSVGIDDLKANIEECSYSNSGCKEDRKSYCKHQENQPNISKADLDKTLTKNAAPIIAGSHMNMVPACSQGTASTSYSISAPAKQFYQSSRQKMVSYNAPSSLNLPTTPAIIDSHSTMVTFSEKAPAHPSSTFYKLPSQQGSPFLGHTLPTPNQGLRQGGTLQQQEKASQRPSAGSPGPATSDSSAQPTLPVPAMARTQGQMPRSQQSGSNAASMSRLPPSMSSAGSTPLSPLSSVSKATGTAPAKNAVSTKDSLSPKSSPGCTPGKKTSISFQTNASSVLGSSSLVQNVPLKPSQAQLIPSQYNIHQQHMHYPFFQPTVQSMDSVQQQQQKPMVTQQYPLPSNQRQAVQLQKPSLTQQSQLQFGQHIFMQQSPQYIQTRSSRHAETPSQHATHSHHVTKQIKQQSGHMASQSQQLGNVAQQQMLTGPAPSFSIATNGDFPAALCLGTSGSIPQSATSDGVMIPQGTSAGPLMSTKLTTDVNMVSSCFQKGSSTEPAFIVSQCGPSNCMPSTQQQVSNSYTVSSPYPNLLSQSMSITDTIQNAGDDKPVTGN